MNSDGDFGSLLEVLVTCVGVVDAISLLALIYDGFNQKSMPTPVTIKDENNNIILTKTSPVKPQKSVTTCPVPQVIVDGLSNQSDDDVIDSLVSKVNELETKVAELETRSRENSMERMLEVERVRRSRSPTPYSRANLSEESSSSDERYRRSKSPSPNQIIEFNRKSIEGESSSFEDESNTTPSEFQSRESSFKRHSKPITRDDEFRKTKRSSQNSHESREDELAALTRIEQEENETLTGFVPIVYEGHEDDVIKSTRLPVSPIQEVNDDENLLTNAETSSSPIDEPFVIDINENFIRMEQQFATQSRNFLVKQAHVTEDEYEVDEKVKDIPLTSPTPPTIEVIEEVNKNINVSSNESVNKKNVSA
jgi:hypothetical protein